VLTLRQAVVVGVRSVYVRTMPGCLVLVLEWERKGLACRDELGGYLYVLPRALEKRAWSSYVVRCFGAKFM